MNNEHIENQESRLNGFIEFRFTIRMNLIIIIIIRRRKIPFELWSLLRIIHFAIFFLSSPARTLRMAFLGLSTKNSWKMIGRQVNNIRIPKKMEINRRKKWKISWIYFFYSIVLSHAFYYNGIQIVGQTTKTFRELNNWLLAAIIIAVSIHKLYMRFHHGFMRFRMALSCNETKSCNWQKPFFESTHTKNCQPKKKRENIHLIYVEYVEWIWNECVG